LTGLYTHLYIASKLNDEVARSERYGSNLSIILFDLDNFKDVNDTYGHLAGDAVLKEVGRIMKRKVLEVLIMWEDTVGRSFWIILPETDRRLQPRSSGSV